MRYIDDFIGFEVPDKCRVKRHRRGAYSVSSRAIYISVAMMPKESGTIFIGQMKACAAKLLGFSEVLQRMFGKNLCYAQLFMRKLGASAVQSQLKVLVRLPGGDVLVQSDKDGELALDQFGDFLASIRLTQGTHDVSAQEQATGSRVGSSGLGKRSKTPVAKRRLSLVVFADHYQFIFYDASGAPFCPMPPLGEQEIQRGWTRNEYSLWYFTAADRNSHRVDVRLARKYTDDPTADRVMVHNLVLSSGRCAIYNHEAESALHVPPGPYIVYTRCYNRGKEDESLAADVAIRRRLDLERYEIVLVRGATQREGTVKQVSG